jgi:hypothetical protein
MIDWLIEEVKLTFTRGSCIPLAGSESMYFLRSWFRNSNTKYRLLVLCTTSSRLKVDLHELKDLVTSTPVGVGRRSYSLY